MSAAVHRAVVVGGGILGTWHALELVRAGFSVDHLEADAAPSGASVRNFGLVWVSGRRSGEELEVALRARLRWEEVGEDSPGIGFRAAGSLTIARSGAEREVMEAYACDPGATARAITFLDPDAVRAANPTVGGDIDGALHCALDAIVEPRLALGALREHVMARAAPGRARFHPGRRVVAVHDHAVVDTTGTRWEGDLVVMATGAAYDHLPGADALGRRLRRVRLQMLETAPFATRLTTSLADADTLRYYPAYESAPLSLLGPQDAVAAEHHLQLLLVQRPDGALTIGDTHAYGEPFDFALCEDPTHELLSRARSILGAEMPPVRRRWEGVYAQCTDGGVCLREQVRPGVFVVTGPGGRGMTCAPAIATDTLAAAGIARVIGPYALACLDMAGTTVADHGAVEEAFTSALAAVGIAEGTPRYVEAQEVVRATMGWSKADVFALVLEPADVGRAADAFAAAYEAIVAKGNLTEVPGALEVVRTLRAHGVAVCLTTGFAPSTREALLGALAWRDEIDLALSPVDVGRGRPEPDLILGAMARLGVGDPRAVAVVGDTVSDLEAGSRAGAGAVIGVLSGAHDEVTLSAAPHTAIIADVTALIPVLEHG